jgi:hypothetical protein
MKEINILDYIEEIEKIGYIKTDELYPHLNQDLHDAVYDLVMDNAELEEIKENVDNTLENYNIKQHSNETETDRKYKKWYFEKYKREWKR